MADDSDPALNFSGVDALPGLSQVKAAYQQYWGDEVGAQETQRNFRTFSLGFSQINSLIDIMNGNITEAQRRHRHFVKGSLRVLKALPDSIPLLGHLVGGARCCLGDKEGGRRTVRRANRSCAVYGAGAAVGSAGVLIAGFHTNAAQHAVMAAVTAVAGVAVGMRADRMWFPRSIPMGVPLTAGQRFDLAVLRFLDGLKAYACMDLVPIIWPEYINQASVWVEPINAADAAGLLTGGSSMGVLPSLDQLNTGMLHSFVLLKTTKGHVLLTERLHDDQILLANLSRPGVIHHFYHGKVMPSTPLEALERSQDGAHLFAVKQLVSSGPSPASLVRFANAQSQIGYDLVRSNCQHYADSVLEFVSGKGLTYLPNGDMLSLSALLLPPVPPVSYTAAGMLSSTVYEVSLAPARAAADMLCVCWPTLPRQEEDDAIAAATREQQNRAVLLQAFRTGGPQAVLQAAQQQGIPLQMPVNNGTPVQEQGANSQLHVYRQDEPTNRTLIS